MVNIKPKKHGAPMINIVCSKCGGYFSERSGHVCGDDARVY